ncbi:small multi-drug export protein [Patescibacteria group bacterium]|nr:small multi-drug export protein [Patescibacteria group bacterium]MBU4481326.1 small multi-drug export protein [Patescibacteria group bacterium]
MTPIGELRIAIPIGLTVYKISPVIVYFFSVLGNLFSVFLILTLLGAFSRWTSKNIYSFNRFFSWLFSKTRKKHYDKVTKYGLYLLPFFVAIPLPATGGWTASLIAFVFGIPFKKAFPLIGLGILAAGLIILFLTRVGITIEKNFGWQLIVGILMIFGISYWLYKKNNNK